MRLLPFRILLARSASWFTSVPSRLPPIISLYLLGRRDSFSSNQIVIYLRRSIVRSMIYAVNTKRIVDAQISIVDEPPPVQRTIGQPFRTITRETNAFNYRLILSDFLTRDREGEGAGAFGRNQTIGKTRTKFSRDL